jgi:hypothetical protein
MAKASTIKRSLTDRYLKSIKGSRDGKPYDIRDTEIRGLRVRVMPSGERTFVLLARYKHGGAPTRRALGGYPALGLAEAREKARELLTGNRGPRRVTAVKARAFLVIPNTPAIYWNAGRQA